MSLARFPRKLATLSLLMLATFMPVSLMPQQQAPKTTVNLVFPGLNSSSSPFFSLTPNPTAVASLNSVVEAVDVRAAVYDRATGNDLGESPAVTFVPVQSFNLIDIHPAFLSVVAGGCDFSFIGGRLACPDVQAVRSSALVNPTTSTQPDILNLSYLFDNTYNLTQRTIAVIDPSPERSFQYNSTNDPINAAAALTPETRPRGAFEEPKDGAGHYIVAWSEPDPSAHLAVFDPTVNYTQICLGATSVPGPLLPAQIYAAPAGAPLWSVAAPPDAGSAITVIRIDNPTPGSDCFSNSTVFVLPVPAYQTPPLISQPTSLAGQTVPLQVPSGATIQGAYGQGTRLEVVHTVSSAADAFSTARVRMYDIDIASGQPQIKATFEVSPAPGVNTYAPAVAVNPAGAIGLTYMESSPAEFPSIYVTAKSLDAPSFGTAVLVKAGATTIGGTFPLFGGFLPGCTSPACPTMVDDFSGMAVDPADGSFWATSETGVLAPSPNWATTIANFSVTLPNPCATDISNSVTIAKSGYVFNPGTQLFSQTMKITNISGSPISGPIMVALDNLSTNAGLFNASGTTSCTNPTGSPYLAGSTGTLLPAAGTSFVLQFTDPAKAAIIYRPRVLVAGTP